MDVKLGDYAWAAAVATDLALTAPEVWTAGEQLRSTEDLARFLAAHQLSSVRATSRDDLSAVREVRTGVRGLIEECDSVRRIELAAAMTSDSIRRLTIASSTGWTAQIDDDLDVARLIAVVAGIGVLSTGRALGSDRFRSCSAATCNGVFIDTSRGGKRRYCMPELCGNRTNVALHRARSTRATSAASE